MLHAQLLAHINQRIEHNIFYMKKLNAITGKILLSFLLGLISAYSYGQTGTCCTDSWIDKNEDESYTARHECSFVQAGDKFVIFGGRESAQKLEMYDYKLNTWSVGGSSPKEFNHFQATAHKGFIWIIGSFRTNKFPREIPADTVWLYHIPSQKWIAGPEIPSDRRRGGAGLVVQNDKFYVVAGNTIGHDGGYINWFDEYDPKTNTWTKLDNAPQARDHFHAAVMGNKLYAAGGRHSGGEGGVFTPCLPIVDVYDFETKKWDQLKAELPTPRAAPGIAVFNDELFVMGGEGAEKGPAYKIVETYNPETGQWTKKADMTYSRHGTQAIVSGNGIYLAAGSPTRGGGKQLNMEVYNEDAPEGIALTASHFDAPADAKIAQGATKKIKVKNTGGNTGSFISSLQLQGENSDQFRIKSNRDLTLIDVNEKFIIEVENIGNSSEATAELVVTYNGDVISTVKLRSK